MDNILLLITAIFYFIAAANLFLFFLFKRLIFSTIYRIFLLSSSAAIFSLLVLRSIFLKFFSITNVFDVALLMLLIVTITLLFSYKNILESPWFFLLTSIILLIVTAVLLLPSVPKTLSFPKPALRSPLLTIHVFFAAAGEVFLALTLFSKLSIFKINTRKENCISNTNLSDVFANLGYFFFTLGALIIGPIWAKLSWGSFWSWDPKETSSLAVWALFSVYILLKNFGKKYKVIAFIILILALAVSIFTFIGIPTTIISLHSH